MGIYSTQYIKRQDAIDFIKRNAEYLTNQELQEVVFEMLKHRTFDNFSIVPNEDEDCAYLIDYDFHYTT